MESPASARSVSRLGNAITRYWGEAIVVALALLLWLPRLSGPIDLRWDAGVYSVLGTSLATGHGYRILSEPGAPEALQYPPLLPAIVASYKHALGAIIAPWLRISYAAVFLIDLSNSLPAVETDSKSWRLVESSDGTKLYERTTRSLDR